MNHLHYTSRRNVYDMAMAAHESENHIVKQELFINRRLKQYEDLCPEHILLSLSKVLSPLEEIYIKYLFKMDLQRTYRYILAAINAENILTQGALIEVLFILKRWHDIFVMFDLDVFKKKECFIVSQFTSIPIKRKLICIMFMLTTDKEKQLILNMIYAFLGCEHLRLTTDKLVNARLYFEYMDKIQLTRDEIMDLITKTKNNELIQTSKLLLAYDQRAIK